MPRSSGGGSHSSGSHSSSSYSSSRSSSSYSSSSSSSSYSSSSYYSAPARRVSHTWFPGSMRYRYYNFRNQPVYVYTNTTPEEPSIAKLVLYIILAGFLIFIGRTFFAQLKDDILKPLPMDGIRQGWLVEDNADILNERMLVDSYKVFMDNTGIIPGVITVNNEDWQPYYASLETYAFEQYLTHFDDEQHFLIVYSQPKEVDPAFNDWYWEAVQGDDTINIITDDTFYDFQMDMQKYLSKKEYDVSRAISECFYNAAENMKQEGPNEDVPWDIGLGITFVAAGGIILCYQFKKYYDAKMLYGAKKA